MTRPIPSTAAGRRLFSDVEPMDMWESDGVTPADIVAVEQEAGELGAAWAEAEAALPGGWVLNGLSSAGFRPSWHASAMTATRTATVECDQGDTHGGKYEHASATGPTPAAALRALAAKLKETK